MKNSNTNQFEQMEKIDSVSKTVFDFILHKYKKTTAFLIVVFFLLLFINPIFAFIVLAIYWAILYMKVSRLFMQQFAKANGLEYQKYMDVKEVKGRLFKVGNSGGIRNVVFGKYKDHPIKIFNYSYSVGSGKNRRTYNFTVFEMVFEKTKFPYILLQSKTMRKYGGTDFWGDVKDTKISLEEEFKKDYKLFSTSGYEVEVFQIFTPEFLREMKERGAHFSIEFADNRLYIYDDLFITKSAELQKMYDVAQKVFDSIGPLLNRLHDDFDALHPYYGEK